MKHLFDVEIAVKYGINAAVLLENIGFWVKQNEANETNYFDGHYWTYNSRRALRELLPYMSERQINTAISKLVDDGLVLTGNYNKSPYDRTLWYTLTDKGKAILHFDIIEKKEMSNERLQNVTPIPDINTDINTDINLIESTNVDSKDFPSEKSSPAPYDKIRGLYNSICKSYPKCTRLSAGRKKAIHARIKSGYTVEDFEKVFRLAEQSRFLKGGNDRNWHADFDWLIKDTNMAKVLDGKYQDRQGGQNNYGCAAGAGASKGSAESQRAYGGILILPSGEIIDETGGSEPVGKDPLYDPNEDW